MCVIVQRDLLLNPENHTFKSRGPEEVKSQFSLFIVCLCFVIHSLPLVVTRYTCSLRELRAFSASSRNWLMEVSGSTSAKVSSVPTAATAAVASSIPVMASSLRVRISLTFWSCSSRTLLLLCKVTCSLLSASVSVLERVKLFQPLLYIIGVNGGEASEYGHHLPQIVQHAQVRLFGRSPHPPVIESACSEALFEHSPQIIVRLFNFGELFQPLRDVFLRSRDVRALFPGRYGAN